MENQEAESFQQRGGGTMAEAEDTIAVIIVVEAVVQEEKILTYNKFYFIKYKS
jgi:hypothetical protein